MYHKIAEDSLTGLGEFGEKSLGMNFMVHSQGKRNLPHAEHNPIVFLSLPLMKSTKSKQGSRLGQVYVWAISK
jgi:hypothetical protein